MSPVYVIAEAGVNHNGSLSVAKELIDVAVQAGADAVKFQTFKTDNLVTRTAEKAKYQVRNTNNGESQYEMLKRLELGDKDYVELLAYCQTKNIHFLSTAFDAESLTFLHDELGLKTLKVASGEITNGPLLLAHAITGADLIVSTGMAALGEVEIALGVIALGYLTQYSIPRVLNNEVFAAAFRSVEGQQVLQEKVILLHCSSEYPTPPDEVNLKTMQTLAQAFGLRVGYSDHTRGIAIPTAAVALGATVIEKHFTLDNELPGPDHKVSLEPDELNALIKSIRVVEVGLGHGVKCPSNSEMNNRKVVRKSLVAAQDIQRGELFTRYNVVVKRPGQGISPMQYWSVLGKFSPSTIKAGEFICV